MYQPPTLTIRVSFPGTLGEASIFDISILGSSAPTPLFPASGTVYDGWCMDKVARIDVPGTYVANVYSSYELGILAQSGSALGANPLMNNLDSINWLLNFYDGHNAGITWGEVQAAMWQLLGQDWTTETAYMGQVDQADVDSLAQQALAHDGFVPDAGEKIGFIVDPVVGGVHYQPLILETQAAKLGDFVFHDSNANGVQNVGEEGIAGAKVELVRDLDGNGVIAADEVLASTATDATGAYSFKGLTPGLLYQVRFTLPDTYDAVSPRQAGAAPRDSDGLLSDVIVLAPGENNRGVDAGFYKYASIGDKVWVDADGFGINDATDLPMAGVTVKLLNAAGEEVSSTVTGANGEYAFNGLVPSTYSVVFVAPQGWGFTIKDQAANDLVDSDANGAGATVRTVLSSGEHDMSWDAGVYQAGSLGDRVWVDANANGQQDRDELGLAGVTVSLIDAAGSLIASQLTDVNGNYTFTNLTPSRYAVQIEAPAGYVFTARDIGPDATDSDPNASTGYTRYYNVLSGVNNRSVDAGLVQMAHLGDKVFHDLDADGSQDANEAGISSVRVQLKDALGKVVQTAVTDADGLYGFDVPPGTYTIQVLAPAGWLISPANRDLDDGADSDIDATGATGAYTLLSGEVNNSADAGLHRLARLGDRVWLDADGNGQQDPGEHGVEAITVNLLDAQGYLVATQLTDVNGDYLFVDLMPGSYKVQFELPAGYVMTDRNIGPDASDSDPAINTATTGLVVLTSGEDNRKVDAGILQLAHIGDRVFQDKLADGVQDGTDTGLRGITVNLLDASGAIVKTTTTDATGSYGFDVRPGTYSVQIVAPAGYLISPAKVGGDDQTDSDIDGAGLSAPISVLSGDVVNSVDGGLYRLATLGDRVWADNNANGVQDDGETGLAGIVVHLIDATGSVIDSQTTDDNGNYLFTSLVPSRYAVQVDVPAGYVMTTRNVGPDATDSDPAVGTGATAFYTLQSGTDNRTVDAGLVQLAHIGDKVFRDLNANGQQDANEAGIRGVRVELHDALGNLVKADTTDADGVYGFDVKPGSYTVHVVSTGWIVSPLDQGADDTLDSDADASGASALITVAAGEVNNSVDVGLHHLARLGDRVWLDVNGNGQQDIDEPGKAGVTVNLLDASGQLLQTQVTDVNGDYLFNDLTPGRYRVQIEVPEGYEITGRNIGPDATDSDPNINTATTGIIVLTSGEDNRSVDAGLLLPANASLAGYVFADANNDGLRSGDAGIAGVSVTLTGTDILGNAVTATALTDVNGHYEFTGLRAGSYAVAETQPADYFDGKDRAGTAGGDATVNDVIGQIVLASGQQSNENNFGELKAASLGDRVWVDTNANGQQDDGATGIAGLTVTLIGGGADGLINGVGDTTANTVTAADGAYKFDGLAIGTQYQVQINKGAGYSWTTADAGNDASDSDANASTGKSQVVTLAAGENNLSIDAGVYQTASIGDRIWYDKNANGLQDSGETGVAGVTVELRDNSSTHGNVLATTTTDASGNYLFSSLKPGDYHIDIVEGTLPAGYVFTQANQGSNDAIDSDVRATATDLLNWGKMDNTTLSSGEADRSWDAGIYKVGIDVEKYVSSALTTTANNGCGEGANVAYWKANCTWQSALGNYGWTGTGCNYATSFNQAFGVNCTGGTQSLWQVLCSTGTTTREVMMRESVAAYLNACHGSVDYAYSRDQVCAQTKYAIACGDYTSTCNSYSSENNRGCNWGTAKTSWSSVVDTTLYDADAPPGLEVRAGSMVTFTYIVKNTGDTALKNVLLVDDRIATVSYVSGDTDRDGLLDTTETWTYTAKEVASAGTIKNTGTVTAVDAVGGVAGVTDKDDAYYTGTGAVATKGSIGDRAWEDKNFNGLQDAGETGIAGAKVTLKGAGADGLFGTRDDVLATTTTNSTGNYEFNNLAAGKYQLFFEGPAGSGFIASKQNIGSNDSTDSDIDTNGATGIITLAAGEHNLTVDAGAYRKASVGDKVWDDMNHNNLQDVGEPGIANIVVKLLSSAGAVLASTTTNSAGNYLFSNLDPGSYILQFDKTNVQHWNYNQWNNMSNWKWAVKDVGTNDAIDSDVNGDGVSYTNLTQTSAFTLVSGQADMSRDAAITPIVIDLDGDGIHTIARADATAGFDLFGNGTAIQSGWLSGNDGFLAVDKNGNGKIDSIAEMFGGHTKGAGFASLAGYDSNHDGLVNSADAAFGQLMIWRDANTNHATDGGELVSLAQAGVASLTVAYTELPFVDGQGNLHLERSSATLASGSAVDMTDVYFNVSADDAKAAGVKLPTMGELLGNDSSLDTVLGASPQALPAAADEAPAAAHDTEVLRRLAALTQAESHAAMAA